MHRAKSLYEVEQKTRKKDVNGEGTRVKVAPPGNARMPHLSPPLTYKQSILTQAAALGPITHILTLNGRLTSH